MALLELDAIYATLEEIVQNTLGDSCKLSEEKSAPLTDVGFSSLSYIEFIVSVEETMEIEFPDDYLEDLAFNNLAYLSEKVFELQNVRDII